MQQRSFETPGRLRRRNLLGSAVASGLGVLALAAGYGAARRLGGPRAAAVDWPTAEPEAVGMGGEQLQALDRRLAARGTSAFLVLRSDRLVHEQYSLPYHHLLRHPAETYRHLGHPAEQPFLIASVAKAVVASTALLLIRGDGLLQLDEPVARLLPAWADHPLKSRITVAQLATHSSGLANAKGREPRDEWEREFWRDPASRARLAIEMAPMRAEPGRELWYSNPGYEVLGYCLAAALRGTTTPDVPALLGERIMRPLGLPEGSWSVSYGRDFAAYGLRVHEVGGGARFTARALARVGRLVLAGGVWEGRHLLDPAVVARDLRPAEVPLPPNWQEARQPVPALGWWSNARGAWKSVPRDALVGAGGGHQLVMVVPSLDLVAVRFGRRLGRDEWGGDYWIALEEQLLAPLAAAVTVA